MDSRRRERGNFPSPSLNHDKAWNHQDLQAVFQTLCRLKLTKHELMPGSGIIITV